jgi:hypothetical protein
MAILYRRLLGLGFSTIPSPTAGSESERDYIFGNAEIARKYPAERVPAARLLRKPIKSLSYGERPTSGWISLPAMMEAYLRPIQVIEITWPRNELDIRESSGYGQKVNKL